MIIGDGGLASFYTTVTIQNKNKYKKIVSVNIV